MVPLRVVPVDLLSRLADLLDDDEAPLVVDDALDRRLLVPREDDEVVALPHDGLVAGGRQLDRLQAGGPAALAMERQRSGDVVPFRARLDPLVHLAEHLLVSRSTLSEVHRPRAPPARRAGPGARSAGCGPSAATSGLPRGRSCAARPVAAPRRSAVRRAPRGEPGGDRPRSSDRAAPGVPLPSGPSREPRRGAGLG